MNNYINLLKEHIKNNYFMIYFVFCLFGLLYLIKLFCNNFFEPFNLNQYFLNSYIISFFNPSNYIVVVIYILIVITAGLSFTVFYILKKYFYEYFNNINKSWVILSTVVFYNVLLAFVHTSKIYNVVLAFVVWLVLALQIFYKGNIFDKKLKLFENLKNTNLLNKICYCLLFASVLQFFILLHPYIFQKPKIMNEFYDIPEISIIKDGKNGVQEIDNISFINKNHLFGVHSKYDIRKPDKISTSHCFEFGFSENLDNMIKMQSYKKMFVTENPDLGFNGANVNYSKYYYHGNNLCLIGVITDAEYIHLGLISTNEQDKANLEKFKKTLHQLGSLRYSEELENNKINSGKLVKDKKKIFIKNNKHEINWQILNRYYLHHQNHLYGPVNEYSLGKNVNDIFFQYGKFNGVAISKIINIIGGLNFWNYMKVLYSSYYIYYAFFIILAFILFRNVRYVVPIAFLSFASICNITDEFLRIAPGASPLRHFFDVLVLIASYWAFYKNSKRALLLTALICCLAILNEPSMGLFITLAFLLTLILKVVTSDKKLKFDIILLVTSPIVYFLMYKLSVCNIDYAVKYFKLGLIAFGTPETFYILFILFILFIYVALVKYFLKPEKERNNFSYICVLLLLYLQMVLVYYVWDSIPDHILSFIPILVLTFFCFLKLYLIHSTNVCSKKIAQYLLILVYILSSVWYVGSIIKFYSSRISFDKIFTTHKIYEWNYPRTNFISTMNPVYFMDSVKMIQKYSPENKIYIISKYDSFIPFIAGKYSGMPFFEVSNFLVSEIEMAECIQTILKDKPEYLYVDKDIDRDFNIDMIDSSSPDFGYLFLESEWRVERLSLLKKIFDRIRDEYETVESSYLLTVYKRKN